MARPRGRFEFAAALRRDTVRGDVALRCLCFHDPQRTPHVGTHPDVMLRIVAHPAWEEWLADAVRRLRARFDAYDERLP